MLARHSLMKTCPNVGRRCLTVSLSNALHEGLRRMSTASDSTESIFSPHASPWDEIFDELKDTPLPEHSPAVNANYARTFKRYSLGGRSSGSKTTRPVAMTHRESQVLDQMFNAAFSYTNTAAGSSSFTGIGQHRSSLMYDKLRQSTRRIRWASDADEDLDRKKEEMEMCESDLQLLEWAMREVFGESQRYEEAARHAPEAPSESSAVSTFQSAASTSQSATSTPQSAASPQPLQPFAYPHLLAALMRTFRDKYQDPHLALAMFDHARNLSIASYVFGCTTPAYNELIETRWRCFRDVRGVCDAFEEMRVNGVALDNRTRILAETIRREVGERTLWQEESSLGSGEVWEMVARIERLAARKPKNSRRAGQVPRAIQAEAAGNRRKETLKKGREDWKRDALNVDAEDGWAFGKWAEKRRRA